MFIVLQLNNLSDLIPSLIACELAVASSSNWRLHVEILEKFSCFPKCLTSDQIYYKFVPLLFRLLSSNVSKIVFFASVHKSADNPDFDHDFDHNLRLPKRTELYTVQKGVVYTTVYCNLNNRCTTQSGLMYPLKMNCSPSCSFIDYFVGALQRYHRGHGFESR